MDSRQTLEAANAAVAAGDYDGFLSFCTEDTHWVFVGDRTLEGREAVRQWMAETYLNPPTNTVDAMIAEGDYVTALGDIAVANRDGTTTHSWYCDVWRLRAGRLAELRAYVIERT